MQMRTLGGRGWYLAEEGETYPRQPEPADGERPRLLPPRVFLYRGFAATAVQVSRGPCLKVDLSVRMIQGQTALSKLNFFRDLLIQERHLAIPSSARRWASSRLRWRRPTRSCSCTWSAARA
ncbi:unnamed protein product [Prorocentrum cordatum]|uniref:Uncharacterized protein n=1 Tax=Prorocentrum cordatum TaxID=2364126 RepID=A0ABN9YBF9_9DINO|nr:unnamed protein product [Polarella glacialis]